MLRRNHDCTVAVTLLKLKAINIGAIIVKFSYALHFPTGGQKMLSYQIRRPSSVAIVFEVPNAPTSAMPVTNNEVDDVL